jgi:hypothetical protein
MKIVNIVKKILFRMKWVFMSPREKYAFLRARAGSLRELRR